MSERFPPLSVFGTLLVLVAIARLALVVLNEPMLAFANQYDMVRTGACVGLYPDLPADSRDAATPEAPIASHRLAGRNASACYPGTEAVLAAVVVAKHSLFGAPGGAFPALRELGILKLALAAAAWLALAAAFWPYSAASLLHGATTLLVMSDPVVSLWFQTLYTEFPVLLGIHVLIGALVAGILREVLPRSLAVLAGFGIVLVAFAKEQFALLPLALLLVAVPRLWVTSRRALIVLFAIAISALAWHALLPRPVGVSQANRTNAYLGVILPSATNPAAAAAVLGLPERCAELSGVTWYLRRGENIQVACPEVFSLSSVAFLRLLPADPEGLARALAKVVTATQNPMLGYLGVVAGKKAGVLEEGPPWVRSAWAPAVMQLPVIAYLGLVFTAMAGLLPAGVFWGATLMRGANADAHAFGAYALMLVLVVLYAAGTTAFGDGLSEAARHNLPGSLALAALLLAALFAIGRPGDVGWGLRMAALVAGLGAIAAGLAATTWAQRQPLALGTIDEPPGIEVPREGFALRGWALDPSGVRSVRIQVGDQNVRIARENLLPSPALARVHGGFPGAMWGTFEVLVGAESLTAPELRILVEVENAQGIVTTVERRRLRPAP